jgi:hypothetical protein
MQETGGRRQETGDRRQIECLMAKSKEQISNPKIHRIK